MVLVAVGEHDGANFVAVLGEIGNVRNDDVHPQQLGFGEHHAGVDDNDVIAPAEGHAVHPELAQTSEGHDLEFACGHGE